MLFRSLVTCSILSSISVIAQSSTQTGAPVVQTHVFSVGAEGKIFTPRNRTIPVGDVAEFRFYPQNHSVVRGEFGPEPCIPYEMTGAGKVGWWSGWMPTAVVDTTTQPVFRIRINDTAPLALYCSAPGSCLQGMMAVINGNATHNINTQLAFARNASASLSPGEYWPEEKHIDDNKTGADGKTNDNSKIHAHGLSTGAVAGIAVGGAAILILAGVLLYMCGRHKSVKNIAKGSTSNKDGNTYEPTLPVFTEANYPQSMKSPAMSDARFSGTTYNGAYSDRSISPLQDERNHSLYAVLAGGHSPSMKSPAWPAPRYEEVHEADSHGVRSVPHQVHELDTPTVRSGTPTTPSRTLSYASNRDTLMSARKSTWK